MSKNNFSHFVAWTPFEVQSKYDKRETSHFTESYWWSLTISAILKCNKSEAHFKQNKRLTLQDKHLMHIYIMAIWWLMDTFPNLPISIDCRLIKTIW